MKYLLSIIFCFSLNWLSINTQSNSETYVYICTGKYAYSYHKKSNCRGLNNCSASIDKVTLKEAKSQKRTPCKICYN